MKIWALAGLFTVLAAPNAFALGSLTDAPPDLRESYIISAELSVREPESARQRLSAKQNPPQTTEEERRTAPRRRQEAQVEPQRPNEARRRRNGALDRVPDAVLIERSGAL